MKKVLYLGHGSEKVETKVFATKIMTVCNTPLHVSLKYVQLNQKYIQLNLKMSNLILKKVQNNL